MWSILQGVGESDVGCFHFSQLLLHPVQNVAWKNQVWDWVHLFPSLSHRCKQCCFSWRKHSVNNASQRESTMIWKKGVMQRSNLLVIVHQSTSNIYTSIFWIFYQALGISPGEFSVKMALLGSVTAKLSQSCLIILSYACMHNDALWCTTAYVFS